MSADPRLRRPTARPRVWAMGGWKRAAGIECEVAKRIRVDQPAEFRLVKESAFTTWPRNACASHFAARYVATRA